MDTKRLRELAGTFNPTELQKTLTEAKEAEKKDEVIEEAGMFGAAGYGGEKSGEQQVVGELAQMLRDIKMAMRDGNMEDAAMLVDRAYSRAAKSARG